jgi:hypothetical protein
MKQDEIFLDRSREEVSEGRVLPARERGNGSERKMSILKCLPIKLRRTGRPWEEQRVCARRSPLWQAGLLSRLRESKTLKAYSSMLHLALKRRRILNEKMVWPTEGRRTEDLFADRIRHSTLPNQRACQRES